MEFKLTFTDEECIEFLSKKGFTIETFTGSEEEDFIGTKEFINFTISIAYKEKEDWDKIHKYDLKNKYGLHHVFNREFSTTIKNVLLQW